MGAEIRDPERTLPRAGWIASGFATVFYAGMTMALLVLLRADAISEMIRLRARRRAGAADVLGIGVAYAGDRADGLCAPASASSAAWDPRFRGCPSRSAWISCCRRRSARVHPRWRTPYVSIIVLAGVASFLLIVFQLGDTMRAAYRTLVSLMVIAGFIPYIYIFGSAWKAGSRLSALGGWAADTRWRWYPFCECRRRRSTNVWLLYEVKAGDSGPSAHVHSAACTACARP